ncbi:PC-esterase domain-containing protein 1A-like [Schistocerca americana]|uniref:PC-esterase domain-containing protein 1A-like n=1 Tax=Schistocerca americana TaxID=7009 RepID=UPI001F4FC551|nr:PC-esterase domain-containing protein 1A-like [Schistocerca americana]XP_046997174.1 PC-esterase domain-containing protein 1A-like [Schistocerca americana]XP_046997175.1 PC-esterase domain-containing protein 1A-like [Schistocerca americana]
MCDIFTKNDMQKLLQNKHVMLIGSSNTRAVYKDLVWLWNSNTLITQQVLKRKLEPSFMGDSLLKGEFLMRGRNYEEVREFKEPNVHIEFQFITRCYNVAVEQLMTDIKKGRKKAPDVLLYNSCLWDLTRWGPNGVQAYKDNLVKLMKLFKQCLPSKTVVIWIATEAVSQDCRGGLFVKQVEFMKHYLRFEVMEANMLARQIVVSYGFDFLDVHYYLRMQIHRRAPDGVHWTPVPVRHVTNLILTHIALCWDCELPGHFRGTMLENAKNLLIKKVQEEIHLPKVPQTLKEKKKPIKLKQLLSSPVVTGSPFRIAMKRKLQNFINTTKEDKENICITVNPSLSDTPKRNVNFSSADPQKPYNDVIRRMNTGNPRPMLGFTQNKPCFYRDRNVHQNWKEPDFSNSPLQNRNYPITAESSHFVYREVTERRPLQSGPFFPPGVHYGPVRQREMSRHNRRHRPYY